MLNHLSFKSKLVLMLLIVSLFSALVVSVLGWRSSRIALTSTVFDNMTALRRGKADQIETYFRNLRYTVEVLSENDMVVEAMVRFNRSFNHLEAYYTYDFFPKLFANLPGQADYALYRPENQAGLYLQHLYIVTNRFEDGEKHLLDQAEDGSDYSKTHAYYHPRLRNLVRRLGFNDLALVNFETGDIVYTVSKQTDFASNLDYGPYRRSNQAAALELVRSNTERGTTQLVDFDFYRPGYGTPAAFWAAPLYNGKHLVGAMLVQISIDAINEIMNSDQQWAQVGLGTTGETYLAGADLMMRSDSRFRLEDPAGYDTLLAELGIPERTIQMIRNFDTTILLQRIDTAAVRSAQQNKDGTEMILDYRRVPVLSSYQPLVVEGLQWSLMAEMDQDEAMEPIYNFQRQLLISNVLMFAFLAFMAVGIAYIFTKPLNLLIKGVRQINQGAEGVEIKLNSRDEFGELATMVNDLQLKLRMQAQRLTESQENTQRLLLNLMPDAVAQRIERGDVQSIEEVQQATLFVAKIVNLEILSEHKDAEEIIEIVEDISIHFDQIAAQHSVEKIIAPDQRYIGFCGLSTPHFDHSRRVLEFTLGAQQAIERLNSRYEMNLNLRIGVHAGSLTGGIVTAQEMVYTLWGETISTAAHLQEHAAPNTILVSQSIYQQQVDQFSFKRHSEGWLLVISG